MPDFVLLIHCILNQVFQLIQRLHTGLSPEDFTFFVEDKSRYTHDVHLLGQCRIFIHINFYDFGLAFHLGG